ncbi:MAG TPA: serine hydrolase domain-containing protein [Micromonosporaceae bacterium]
MLDNVLRQLDIGMPRSDGPIDLATAMALCHTPGVGIALILDGAVAETCYAGVREIGGAPVDEHTLFQAGSVAKSVAAACALRLVADGVLGLDDDVNVGLRSWRVPANDGWQPVVTLRQLLGHTAATTAGGYIGYPRGAHVPTVPEILDGRGNSEAVVVTGLPGLRYGYSGGGYLVAQQLCVDVTGTDFPTLAKRLVLDPAGMVDSTFAQPLPDALASNAASGHHPGPVMVPGRWHTYPEMAAGGLWTTATDLARFFLAIRAGLTGAPGGLLPRAVTEEMATPLTDVPYGLGLVVAPPGEPARIANFGNDQGFENHATVQVESGQGLVVTTNSFYGKELINYVLLPAVRRELGWPGSETVTESGEAVPGRYGDIGIERDGDDLLLNYPAQPAVRLVHGGGRWRAREINLDAWFEDGVLLVDQSGSVTRHGPA